MFAGFLTAFILLFIRGLGFLFMLWEVMAAKDASSFSHIMCVLLSLLLLWSVYVSYCGATTTFLLNRGLALLWFVGLPIELYIFILFHQA